MQHDYSPSPPQGWNTTDQPRDLEHQAHAWPQPHLFGNGEYDPEPASRPVGTQAWLDFSNPGYLKGFLVGVGAALLFANPNIQKALVKGTVKLWSVVQGSVEEVKEQFQDVKAEMSQEK
ncbi:MAG: YtxH domain-containing protein [Pseudomonadota bacterium]